MDRRLSCLRIRCLTDRTAATTTAMAAPLPRLQSPFTNVLSPLPGTSASSGRLLAPRSWISRQQPREGPRHRYLPIAADGMHRLRSMSPRAPMSHRTTKTRTTKTRRSKWRRHEVGGGRCWRRMSRSRSAAAACDGCGSRLRPLASVAPSRLICIFTNLSLNFYFSMDILPSHVSTPVNKMAV